MGFLYGWWRKAEEAKPTLKDVLEDSLVREAKTANHRHLQQIESKIATTVDRVLGVLYHISNIEYHPSLFGLTAPSGSYYSFDMAGATWRYYPVENDSDILWIETPSGRAHKIDNPIDLYRALDAQ